jgi:hypothetical protein
MENRILNGNFTQMVKLIGPLIAGNSFIAITVREMYNRKEEWKIAMEHSAWQRKTL